MEISVRMKAVILSEPKLRRTNEDWFLKSTSRQIRAANIENLSKIGVI